MKDKSIQYTRVAEALNINNDPNYLITIANLYSSVEKPSESLRITRKLLELCPNNAEAQKTHAITCSKLKLSEEAKISFRKSLTISENVHTRSLYLFNLIYQSWASPEEYKEEALRYGKLAKAITKNVSLKVSHKSPNRVIRLGFISGDFREHSVGYFLQGLLNGLSKLNCETIAFSTYTTEGEMTKQLESKFTEWHDVEELNISNLGQLISDSKVDVLFDLSGHTEHHRLLASVETM